MIRAADIRTSLPRACCRTAARIHAMQHEDQGTEPDEGDTFRCPDEDCRRIAVWRRGAWREKRDDAR